MKRIGSPAMPLPILAAIVVSLVALGVLWLAPVAGLVLLGAVVLGGLVLFVAGSRAAGVVVALMPFAILLLATQLVGTLWFKPYRVPSESMVPTIDIGDRVLADRHDKTPQVGDVVVAHPPTGAQDGRCGVRRSEDSRAPWARAMRGLLDVKFIKRVVAGPGDTVAFRHGLVIRNGRAVKEPYARPCTDQPCELPAAIKVPPGTWYLAGDSRGESSDSRFWGPVPTAAIIGIVKYRYWPLGRAGRL